jgi:hypothetical protein
MEDVMQTEQNKPQEQPAEGDRDMIDRELKRQDGKLAEDNRKPVDEQQPDPAAPDASKPA